MVLLVTSCFNFLLPLLCQLSCVHPNKEDSSLSLILGFSLPRAGRCWKNVTEKHVTNTSIILKIFHFYLKASSLAIVSLPYLLFSLLYAPNALDPMTFLLEWTSVFYLLWCYFSRSFPWASVSELMPAVPSFSDNKNFSE